MTPENASNDFGIFIKIALYVLKKNVRYPKDGCFFPAKILCFYPT
jgi:hypothetical protein